MNETEFLKQFVEIYSPTGNTSSAAQFLLHQLQKIGFHTEIDSHGNVLAAFEKPIPTNPTLLFCGHYDTVPGKIPVRIEKNQLHGRGSVDAKGAIVAFSCAATRIMNAGKKISLVIAACPDEEGISNGAKALLQRFNPQMIVIGEPSGAGAITIGYRGYTKLEIVFQENSHHKSTNVLGANEQAIEFWQRVRDHCDRHSHGKSSFEKMDAYLLSMHSTGDGLMEIATLHIGLRFPPGVEWNEIEKKLHPFSGKGKLTVLDSVSGFKSGRANALVNAFAIAIRKKKGNIIFKQKTGTADFNILGKHYQKPILAYGPGDSALDHSPHEHLDLDEFSASIEIIESALKKIFQ